MEETDLKFMLEDFKLLDIPNRFNGGCRKTRLEMYCYRIKPDGSIGSLTENCEHWPVCLGYKYNYRI